ncbi:hypothetical protein CYPRO_1892 [Cyclonatronum proteinivorum]|uniref:Uncharacterized protein n=1 Tax=Cyclonatronum proteinivorum TaxID=1457365 RepID=A0A345UKZ0_9BACT|nr:hypothetical protein [Cyclonatronum proteinivorum]AXJ01142.1 hypothetical protein CYPRO_1892 [Cyclonatronum proteinivorum]
MRTPAQYGPAFFMKRSRKNIKTFITGLLLLPLFFMAGCSQFPGHYIAFNTCLQENTSIGEDFLVAFAELEEYLISEGYLEDISRESYRTTLNALATGSLAIEWRSVAPHVRDFWGLQQEGTFGAFPSCARQISSENTDPEQAQSLQNLSEVYDLFFTQPDASFRDPALLNQLSDAVTDDDFAFMLYRAPQMIFMVYLME